MLKYLSILAAVIAFGNVSADAQQREAVFQRIDVPNATFDIVVATAKLGSSAEYYRDQPDPNLIYLGEELVAAYTPELAEMLSLDTLLHPKHTLVPNKENGRTPVLLTLCQSACRRRVPPYDNALPVRISSPTAYEPTGLFKS